MSAPKVYHKASYELDKAVAEACGIQWYNPYDFAPSVWIRQSLESGRQFSPSTDWNDAMLAAEKCGLFDMSTHTVALDFSRGKWRVNDGQGGSFSGAEIYSEHESGPMAICLAILKIKGVECPQS